MSKRKRSEVLTQIEEELQSLESAGEKIRFFRFKSAFMVQARDTNALSSGFCLPVKNVGLVQVKRDGETIGRGLEVREVGAPPNEFVVKQLRVRLGPEQKEQFSKMFKILMGQWVKDSRFDPTKSKWYEDNLFLRDGSETYSACSGLLGNQPSYAEMELDNVYGGPRNWGPYVYGDGEVCYLDIALSNIDTSKVMLADSKGRFMPNKAEHGKKVYANEGVSFKDVDGLTNLARSDMLRKGQWEADFFMYANSITWKVGTDTEGKRRVYPIVKFVMRGSLLLKEKPMDEEPRRSLHEVLGCMDSMLFKGIKAPTKKRVRKVEAPVGEEEEEEEEKEADEDEDEEGN